MMITLQDDRAQADLAERAETIAAELASHAGVRPVVFGRFAMELAGDWQARVTPLEGEGAPIVLLSRLSRWLVLKIGASDAIFVFSRRDPAVRRARALAWEQGVAFFALGPSGGVTDRRRANRDWEVAASVDAEAAETGPGPVEQVEAELAPLEIRIERRGQHFALFVDDVILATAASRDGALRKADLLRNDPDIMAPLPMLLVA
jgi:hypothetical protein